MAGEPQALRLVQFWIRSVVCFQFGFSAEDAEDRTHETYLILQKRFESLEINSSPAAYIKKIARNLCLKKIRRDGRIQFMLPENLERFRDESGLDLRSYDNRQIATMLQRAIVQLTFVCRTVLYLRYFEGLSYPEMATRLNRAEGSCQANVKRCLEKLRREFKKLLDDDLNGPDILEDFR